MKKKILCWALSAMLVLPTAALAAEESETELPENQRKATIMVVSITGNELTYMEMNTENEDASEQESEEMPEPESGDQMPEGGPGAGGDGREGGPGAGGDGQEGGPGAGGDGQGGGPGAGGDGQPGGPGGMDMSDMQDMIEQFQENGGDGGMDMSGVQDMIEQFQENGGQMPGGGGQAADDGSQADDSQAADGDAQEGGPGAGGTGGGGQPGGPGGMDMSAMQDMIEQFQENGGDGGGMDMSGVQDMIEQFQENGGMPGGDGQEGAPGGGAGFGGAISEPVTVYLPVGVVVHADGKDKTFSILEAGDELEVLFETDEDGNEVITEMWLLDT